MSDVRMARPPDLDWQGFDQMPRNEALFWAQYFLAPDNDTDPDFAALVLLMLKHRVSVSEAAANEMLTLLSRMSVRWDFHADAKRRRIKPVQLMRDICWQVCTISNRRKDETA